MGTYKEQLPALQKLYPGARTQLGPASADTGQPRLHRAVASRAVTAPLNARISTIPIPNPVFPA